MGGLAVGLRELSVAVPAAVKREGNFFKKIIFFVELFLF